MVIGIKSLEMSLKDDTSMDDISRNKASLIIFDLFSYLFLETNLLINLLRFSFKETDMIGMGSGLARSYDPVPVLYTFRLIEELRSDMKFFFNYYYFIFNFSTNKDNHKNL